MLQLQTRMDELEQRLKAHTLRVVLTTNVPTVALVAGIAFTAAGLR